MFTSLYLSTGKMLTDGVGFREEKDQVTTELEGEMYYERLKH